MFYFFCFDFRENDDVIYLVICVNHKYKLGLGGQGGKPNTQINRYQIHKYTKGHIKLGARKFVYLSFGSAPMTTFSRQHKIPYL